MNKQIEEMNRPRNEELFNNLDKQYREIAKIQEREKQIDIIEADIKTGMRDMEEVNPKVYKGLNYRTAAKHLEAIGYRKQSEGEWVKINPNNVLVGEYYCSCCNDVIDIADGRETPLDRKMYYCHNCGARMRKEDEGK